MFRSRAHAGTVLLVDDDEGVGRIVRKYLAGWTVEHAYCLWQGHQRIDSIADLKLAILDLDLPDGVAFDATKPDRGTFELAVRLRREKPDVPVVIFSGHVSPALINHAYILRVEYIVKQDYNEMLTALGKRLNAFERIGSWRGAALAEQLRRTSGLSTREVEVMELAMTGLGPSEIAQRLGLTRGTIRTHLERIQEKTGLERRDLVEAARRDMIARDRSRN